MSTVLEDRPRIDFAAGSGLIHPAIIAIMRAVDPIAKNKQAMGYNYRGIDQVYNAVHPHFAEQGVYSTSEVIDAKHIDGKSDKGKGYVHAILKMRFTFWATDGSHVSTEVIGEGIDYGGDKASNKAMSVADKYAILQLLKIPTAMVDSDAAAPEDVKKDVTPAAPRKSAMELMQEAADAEQVKANNNGHTEATLITPEQLARLDELTTALNCHDKIQKAVEKRKLGSRRSLTIADAAGIIQKLETELVMQSAATHAATQPAVDSEPARPCDESQVAAIKASLAEWAQIDRAGYDAAIDGIKKKLIENGRQKFSDLSQRNAAVLLNEVQLRKMDAFFKLSLENWPLQQVTGPGAPQANESAAKN